MLKLASISLVTGFFLVACMPTNAPEPTSANPAASVPPSVTPETSELADTPTTPTNTGQSPAPMSSASPDTSPDTFSNNAAALQQQLSRIARLRMSNQNDRFLDAKNETTQFNVVFVDALGAEIDGSQLRNVVLNWESSRPQDISVDAQGQIQALVEFGFADIVVRIPDTEFEARTRVSVNATQFSSGSGGGGSSGENGNLASVNTAPIINSLQASSTNVVGTGTPVQLTATASDAESTLSNAQFSWSCLETACQSFSATGPTVIWASPDASGAYTLLLTVTDGSLSTQQNIIINVTTGRGQVNL